LRYYILLFLAIELIFIFALLIILFLLKYINDRDGSYIVNSVAIFKFLADYLMSTVVIVIIGLVMSSIVMKKKYFKYKTDGMRAIRSLQEIMVNISAVVCIIPFFML
jgi:hypothetical protein